MKQTLLLLLTIITLIQSSTCPAGFWHDIPDYERPCKQCPQAHYCPGDDNIHPCPANTIAPVTGLSRCQNCSSGRADKTSLFCILPDTPLDARQTMDSDFALDAQKPYWYELVAFGNFGSYTGDILEISFIDKIQAQSKTTLTVYASTKTGKPSASNFEFKGSGSNVTIAVPRVNNERRVPIYYSIVPSTGSANFHGSKYYWLSKIYNIVSKHSVIDAGTSLARWVDNGAIFVYKGVPDASRVNFSIAVEGMRFKDNDVQYRLFYSNVKGIEYPNEFNANVMVRSVRGQVSRASLVVEMKEGGELRVGMDIRTIWDARITVDVDVSKV